MTENVAYKNYPVWEHSPKQFSEKLKEHFLEKGFDPELSIWLAYELPDVFAEDYTPYASAAGSTGRGGRATQYVIQGRELQLLDCLISGVISSAASAGYLMTDPNKQTIIAALSGIVVASAKMIRNLIKRGAHISLTEYKVLSALRSCNRGGDLETITNKVNEMYECPEAPWQTGEVRRSLDILEQTPLRDGTIVSFAKTDGNGLWHACGFE